MPCFYHILPQWFLLPVSQVDFLLLPSMSGCLVARIELMTVPPVHCLPVTPPTESLCLITAQLIPLITIPHFHCRPLATRPTLLPPRIPEWLFGVCLFSLRWLIFYPPYYCVVGCLWFSFILSFFCLRWCGGTWTIAFDLKCIIKCVSGIVTSAKLRLV